MANPGVCDTLRNETFRAEYHPSLANRPTGAQAQLILFCIENALLFVFVFIFWAFKNIVPGRHKFSRLRSRPTSLVFLSHCGAALVTVIGSWYQSHELEDGMPCWVFIGAYFSLVPSLIFPFVVRLITFYRESVWTEVVMTVTGTGKNSGGPTKSTSDDAQGADNISQSESELSQRSSVVNRNGSSYWRTFLRVMFHQPMTANSSAKRAQKQLVPVTGGDDNEAVTVITGAEPDQTELAVMRMLKSKRGMFLTLNIVFAPYVLTLAIALGVNPMVANNCWGCYPSRPAEIVLIIQGLLAWIFLLFAYRMVRNRKDPFGILTETKLAILLGGLPACIALILNTALKPYTQGDFQFMMIVELTLVVYCFIQSGLQCILAVVDLRKDSTTKKQAVYTITEFEKEFVRRTGPYHEAFGRHLASEHGYESMAFLVSVFQWEKEFFDVSPKTARARAKKIVNTYVGNDAETPCNLSEYCVKTLQSTIQKNDDDLKFDFFQLARSEILKMLFGDSFARFLRSSEYKALEATMGASSPSMSA